MWVLEREQQLGLSWGLRWGLEWEASWAAASEEERLAGMLATSSARLLVSLWAWETARRWVAPTEQLGPPTLGPE